MDRKQTYKPDTDAMLQVMKGDIPSSIMEARNESEQKTVPDEVESQPDDYPIAESDPALNQEQPKAISQKPPARRRKDSLDYQEVFLVRSTVKHRFPIYIEKDIYDTISKNLRVLSDKLSVPGFIHNILTHHLEHYGDQIKEIYKNNVIKNLE